MPPILLFLPLRIYAPAIRKTKKSDRVSEPIARIAIVPLVNLLPAR